MFLFFSLLFCHLNFPAPFHDKETKTWLAPYQNIIFLFFSGLDGFLGCTPNGKKHSKDKNFCDSLLSQNCFCSSEVDIIVFLCQFWHFCVINFGICEFLLFLRYPKREHLIFMSYLFWAKAPLKTVKIKTKRTSAKKFRQMKRRKAKM